MARPKAEAASPEALLALADEHGRLAVRVTPNAALDSLEIGEGKLLARVRAVPEDGKANKAVLALLAKALGVAPSRLRLVREAGSREKLVEVEHRT